MDKYKSNAPCTMSPQKSIASSTTMRPPPFAVLLVLQATLIPAVSSQFLTKLRFQKWFDFHNTVVHKSSTGCSTTLSMYEASARAFPGAQSTQLLCYSHMDCVLDAIGPSSQVKYGSASVLLGLAPVILAGIGFTIGEIASIAVHRPVLSFLLSMGSPVVFSSRVLSYSDPEEAWCGTGSSQFVLNGMNRRMGMIVSILQYVLAISSVANVFTLVIEISARSIVSFDCVDYWKPTLWAIIPLFIHIMGTMPYLMGLKRTGNLYARPQRLSEPVASVQETQLGAPQEKSSRVSLFNQDSQPVRLSLLQKIQRYFIMEMTICACRPPVSVSSKIEVPLWSKFFNCAASFVSLIHILFGTLLFSSVYFVRVEIAVYCVVRFIVSAVLCRLILIVEFAGMRGDVTREE